MNKRSLFHNTFLHLPSSNIGLQKYILFLMSTRCGFTFLAKFYIKFMLNAIIFLSYADVTFRILFEFTQFNHNTMTALTLWRCFH